MTQWTAACSGFPVLHYLSEFEIGFNHSAKCLCDLSKLLPLSVVCSLFSVWFFFFFQFNFPYLVLAALGLRCCVGAFSSCAMQASHCGGLSRYGEWAPGCMSSAVVAHRLSYPVACRIFPDEGSNPCSPHWQVDLLPLGKVLYQGSPVKSLSYKVLEVPVPGKSCGEFPVIASVPLLLMELQFHTFKNCCL